LEKPPTLHHRKFHPLVERALSKKGARQEEKKTPIPERPGHDRVPVSEKYLEC
jgi:hypothetical protein